MTNEKVVENKPEFHTLLTREVQPELNWHELLIVSWPNARTCEDMISILHRGFGVSLEKYSLNEKEYTEIDRIIFYLTIADGWADYNLLKLLEDSSKSYCLGRDNCGNRIYKSPSEIRQMVAKKAFDMLCLNTFRLELKTEDDRGFRFNYFWNLYFSSEKLFNAVRNFFTVEKRRFHNDLVVRNLSRREDQRSNNEKNALTFLINLATFIWEWEEPHGYVPEDRKEETNKFYDLFQSRIKLSKPWMIEILNVLGKLDLLEKWIFDLDESCIAKLKEIALRSKLDDLCHPVRDDRPVKTLDEACYVGSSAAWFLKKYELLTKEYKRLSAIVEAEEQKEVANRKIKKLNGNR